MGSDEPAPGLRERFEAHKRQQELAKNVWLDDDTGAQEWRSDNRAARVRAPLFQSSSKPHTFTAEQRLRMDRYESLEYWDSHNLIYKEHIKLRQTQRRWMKWLIFVAIGVAVGLWAFLFFQTIDAVNTARVRLFEEAAKSMTARLEGSGAAVTPAGAPYRSVFAAFAVYFGFAVILGSASALLCTLFPPSAGSGVPDVMAYLNGVLLPSLFNVRVFALKTLSCICSVGSGLPVGAEGPTIHIGALIGAGLPQGGSKTLRYSYFGSGMFNSPENQRDFISAGAAAGVTAAFLSPIGGLLFVLEEIASFFPAKLAWMVFSTCLTCILVLQLGNSYVRGWSAAPRDGAGFGSFLSTSIAMFNTDAVLGGESAALNLKTFGPSIVIGIFTGFLAVVFTLGNYRVLNLRARYVTPSTRRKVAEPVIFAVIFALVTLLVTLPFSCLDVPDGFDAVAKKLDIELVKELCADPHTQFHPLGTLTQTSAYNTLRMLFSRETHGLLPWHALLLYLILYGSGAMVASGMFIASGVVIPTLTIGAISGRFVGELFGNPVWADPGVTALIGAAAFFGGQSRLTFSLMVIMMELTGDIAHMPCVAIAVFIAKSIGDKFCHSMYHKIMAFKCVPFLDAHVNTRNLASYPVQLVMAKEPRCVHTTESVLKIVGLLLDTTHHCFPVVSLADGKTFRGTILRRQLSAILWFIHDPPTDGPRGHHATYAQLQAVAWRLHWESLPVVPPDLGPEILRATIDLNPYVDAAAFCARELMCLERAYDQFRLLGLRHLPVVDRQNHVVGMLSRKELLMDRVQAKIDALEAVGYDEEDDDDPPPDEDPALGQSAAFSPVNQARPQRHQLFPVKR